MHASNAIGIGKYAERKKTETTMPWLRLGSFHHSKQPRLLLITNREVPYALSDKIKIIDFG